MKFIIKKGTSRFNIFTTLDDIKDFLARKVSPSFYSRAEAKFLEELQKDIIIEIRVKRLDK